MKKKSEAAPEPVKAKRVQVLVATRLRVDGQVLKLRPGIIEKPSKALLKAAAESHQLKVIGD